MIENLYLNNTNNVQVSTAMAQAKGLLNMPGQNNCFLNSAVQVLWHLDHFRNSIDLFSGHYCTSATAACVFCSLSNLFSQLRNSTRTALNADQLRRALAHTFSAQRRFQLGLMDDAIECFEHILQRLHFHCVHNQVKEEECDAYYCLSHALFSMRLIERRRCARCGSCEAKTPYNQYVQYVSTPALIEKALCTNSNISNKLSFGSLVRSVCTQGEIRDCTKQNCGSRVQLRKTLLNAPNVLALGLNYENERPSIDQIADVFKLVDTYIRLSDVFEIDAQNLIINSGDSNCDVLHLVGLVTYYGKHYCTFFYNTQLGVWLYLDDANVKEIGSQWSFVVEKCVKAHFQPLMLLYANSNTSSSIDANQAPKAVYQVPSNLKSMSNKIINKNNKSDTQLIKKNFEGQSNFNSIINRRSASQLSQLVLTNKLVNSINQSSFNYNLGQNEDVPDSPFAKSSTTSSAYFSDNAETEAQYISRKTVQNILTAQRQLPTSNTELEKNKNVNKYPQQRNSSSSIDSLQDQSHISNYKREYNLTSLSETDPLTNNNFSAKAQILNSNLLLSNNENINGQILQQTLSAKENSNSKIVLPFRKELKSTDAGYDSYSLSSSDSYPSIGGSAVTAVGSVASSSGCSSASSNDKKLSLNNTLRSINEQIISNNESLPINQNNNSLPAEQQLLNLINENKMQDCDKLCSESDILLLRSHEKERESDLKAAAILSEDAAQKARAAMDAPYSNSHALISAKMKHSMCVMRSAALHRRIKELELEEKKKLKNIENNHHSRQSSRDSLSRQFKRNSLDKLNKLNDSVQQNLNNNTNQQSERNNCLTTKAVQLYCTLPKKPSSTSSLSQINKLKNSEEQDYQNFNVANNQLQQQIPQQLLSSSVVKVKSKNMLNRNASSCSTSSNTSNNTKDLDSSINDNYSEIGDYVSNVKNSNKQHKIRKKLLIGNFIKRKNRSLPDLRDNNNKANNQEVEVKEDSKIKTENEKGQDVVNTTIITKKELNNTNNSKNSDKPSTIITPDKQNVAKVSRKGFHPVFDNQNVLSSSSSIKLVNPPVLNNCQAASVKTFKNQQVLNKSNSSNDFSKPILQELNAPPKAILPSPSLKNKSIKNSDYSDVSIKNQTESQSLMKNSSQNFNSSNSESNTKTLTPPLPPVNEKEIINLKISVETSDELPPPPDHFLEDLREKRLIEKQLTERNNQEQISNLINENIENEIKEIKLQMSYNNLNKPPVVNSPSDNRAAVRNLTTKFEKMTTLSNDNKSQSITNKPPLPSIESYKKQIDSSHYDTIDSCLNSKLGTSQKSGLRVAVLGLKNQPAQVSIIRPNEYNKNVMQDKIKSTIVTNHQYQQNNSSLSMYQISNEAILNNSANLRHDKPPDYNTTIKRLGLSQNLNSSPTKSSSLNSSLDSPFKNSLNESANSLTLSRIQQLKQQQFQIAVERRKKSNKKTVSFSDEVILVAPEEEFHYPNPLLDRVLKKNNGILKPN